MGGDEKPPICSVHVGQKKGKMDSIKSVLMNRDGMTAIEADKLIAEAKQDLHDRLSQGEMPEDICEEWFGLEPDYIMELL